jgi:mRNA interferase RelE/StbE
LPELVLTARAKSDLKDLPSGARTAAARLVEKLRLDPRVIGNPLLGRLRPLWSARVGNYRVIYTIEGERGNERVVVRAIKHRTVAYGRRRVYDG